MYPRENCDRNIPRQRLLRYLPAFLLRTIPPLHPSKMIRFKCLTQGGIHRTLTDRLLDRPVQVLQEDQDSLAALPCQVPRGKRECFETYCPNAENSGETWPCCSKFRYPRIMTLPKSLAISLMRSIASRKFDRVLRVTRNVADRWSPARMNCSASRRITSEPIGSASALSSVVRFPLV